MISALRLLCAAGLAGGGLLAAAGGFRGQSEQCELVGKWSSGASDSVELAPDGVWRWHNRRANVTGRWQLAGTELRLSDESIDSKEPICPHDQIGSYELVLDRKACTASLLVREDPCVARARVLKNARLFRPGSRTAHEEAPPPGFGAALK